MAQHPYPGVPIVTHEGETIREVLDRVLTSSEAAKMINGYQYDGTPPTLAIPGILEFVKMRVDEIIAKLLSMAGNFAYFFDNTNKLHIVNFDELPGIKSSHGVKIESLNGVGIIADRSMYWQVGNVDWSGGHSSFAATAISNTWYFGEGCTDDFDTYIEILNPNISDSSITITYILDSGSPVTQSFIVPANSRYTVHVNEVAAVSSATFGMKVESTNGVGIVAERSMYWNYGDLSRVGGHCSRGVTSPGLTWYFAEGKVEGSPSFDAWLCIINPNGSTSNITITFIKDDGSTITYNTTVNANCRKTINLNSILPTNITFGMKVESTNGITIVPERSMYWDANGITDKGGHCSIGSPSLSENWYFAEGCTGGPFEFDQYLLLVNPNPSASAVTITYMLPNSSTIVSNISIPATTRQTIYVNDITGLGNTDVSTKITVTNGIPIMAERAMYWNSDAVEWIDGHCSMGVTAPVVTQYLAEGCTTNTFDEWILIQNPSSVSASVQLTFMDESGDEVVHVLTAPPTSRSTVAVNAVAENMRHLYVGQENEAIADHSEYNVISCSITNSIKNCYTRAIVTGAIEYKEYELELQVSNEEGTLWDATPIPEEATDISFYEIDYLGEKKSISGTYTKEDKTVVTESLLREEETKEDGENVSYTEVNTNNARNIINTAGTKYKWDCATSKISNKEWLLETKDIRLKEGDCGGWDWVDGAVQNSFGGPYYKHYDESGTLIDTTSVTDYSSKETLGVEIVTKVQFHKWSNYLSNNEGKQEKSVHVRSEVEDEDYHIFDDDEKDQLDEEEKKITHLSKLICKYKIALEPPYEVSEGGNAADLGLDRTYYLTLDTTNRDILQAVADSLIAIYGDVEVTGSATIDGIQTDWQVSDGATIHNTARVNLEPIGARITQIDFNLADLTTSIQFTNRPAIANSDLMSHINTKYKLEKLSYDSTKTTEEPTTY